MLARSRYLEIIYFPVKILRTNLPPHPPDGLLLVVMTLVFIFGVHLFALIYGLWSVLRTRIRKLRIKAQISYSRIKVELNSSPQFSRYGTLRELKSRIFVSVPVQDWVFNMNMGIHTKIWPWGCYIIYKVYLIFFPIFEDPQADTNQSFLVGHIFTSVAYTSDDIRDYDSVATYDSDAIQCILDNSANAHIWAILADFVAGTLRRFRPSAECGVLTIGGSNQFPHSIGDIKVYWLDSVGATVNYILKDALYFPDSPVNIISVTAFTDQLEDDEGTWIMTKRHHSIFTWDFGKHSIELTHPATRLPTMRVNEGFSGFHSFCTFLSKAGVTSSRRKMAYTSQAALCNAVDDGVPPLNSGDLFDIGDTLKFTMDGSCELVELLDIDINFETMVPYFKIRLQHGVERTVTREHLSPKDTEDLFQLPISAAQVREHAAFLDTDTLQATFTLRFFLRGMRDSCSAMIGSGTYHLRICLNYLSVAVYPKSIFN